MSPLDTCPHACRTPCLAPCPLGAPCHERHARRRTIFFRSCVPPARHVPGHACDASGCPCPCRALTGHAWLRVRTVPARGAARVRHEVHA